MGQTSGSGDCATRPTSMPSTTSTPFPLRLGQVITGAKVVGVWDRFGAMLDIHGPKKWTNNWVPSGAHLRERAAVDVRIKSINTPNRKVILELLDTLAPGKAESTVAGYQ